MHARLTDVVHPQTNPKRQRGRAFPKTLMSEFCEAFDLAGASGSFARHSQIQKLAGRFRSQQS